jgi:hypothetical protein
LFLAAYWPLRADARSKISISVSVPASIKVVIDGYKYYSEDNNITINNLASGVHTIRIFYIKRSYSDQDHDLFFNDNQNINWKTALNSQVSIKNNFHYDIMISRFGKVFYDKNELRMSFDNEDLDYDDDIEFSNGYNEGYDDRKFFQDRFNQTADYIFKDDKNSNHSDNVNDNNNNYESRPGTGSNKQDRKNEMMSTASFEQLKEMVRKEIVNSNRLNLIKDATRLSMVTSQQARDLGLLFNIEFTKVDYAKYIYARVADKKNFFIIYEIFQSSFSKDEVSNYVKSQEQSY